MHRVIIIGSGISGMAAAIRLRAMGHEVLVLESHETFGGKIKQHLWQGFRFDTGPSLFTLPELVTELLDLGIEKGLEKQTFEYKQLKVVTRYFYANGKIVDSYSDPEQFALHTQEILGVPAQIVKRYLQFQEKTYQLLAPVFIEKPIHLFFRLFRLKNIPALLHVMQPSFMKSLHHVNKKWFRSDELIMLFDRYGTYNGSNPYKMPSLFSIISHLEHNLGAYIATKGMYQIPDTLYKHALQLGVRFRFGSQVEKIEVQNNCAKGVWFKNTFLPADVVISNMDINNTYAHLLPQIRKPWFYLKNEKSTSALIFHWAVSLTTNSLQVHNILFSDNYELEFRHLFTYKKIYTDPTVYIYISKKACPEDAPDGCENWFVMINTPHLEAKIDWEQRVSEIKEIILHKIKKMCGLTINHQIIHEHIITPADIQNQTYSYLGSLYGASSNSLFSAFLRHPNFCSIKNLFFSGGTVHPGGGIPLCLLSAKITCDLINEGFNIVKND